MMLSCYPVSNGDSTKRRTVAETPFTDGNINDSYLTGKMLIDSGTKVQFDGNPKNYITFRQGMDKVLSMHNPHFGLVYDILQARCTGKATRAI